MIAATVTEGFQVWVMRVLQNEPTFYLGAAPVAHPHACCVKIDLLQTPARFSGPAIAGDEKIHILSTKNHCPVGTESFVLDCRQFINFAEAS
jgi:hypothetical protein